MKIEVILPVHFSIEYEVDDESPSQAEMTEKTTKAAKIALNSFGDTVMDYFVEESTEATGFLVLSASWKS